MKKRVLAAGLLCLCMLCLCLPADGYESTDPPISLYHNDEAWYKDAIAPLLSKDGVYHIPVDILEMFSGITIDIYVENNNVLIRDTTRNHYVSVLYDNAAAAVNGRIVEGIEIFRQNGYYYIDAAWIADLCGLDWEFRQSETGSMQLRLTNGSQRHSFAELLASLTDRVEEDVPSGDVVKPETGDTERKRIYLVSTDTPGKDYSAADAIAEMGFPCTEFLKDGSSTDRILRNVLFSTGGVYASDGKAATADRLNERVESLLCRRLSLVLVPYAIDTTSLEEAGYIPIIPDFTVDYQTDPDRIYREMIAYLEEHEYTILRLDWDGCSQRMLLLLQNLLRSDDGYTVCSLTEWD